MSRGAHRPGRHSSIEHVRREDQWFAQAAWKIQLLEPLLMEPWLPMGDGLHRKLGRINRSCVARRSCTC